MDTLGRSYHIPKDPTGVITGSATQLDVLQFVFRYPFVPSHYIDTYFKSSRYVAKIRAELFAKDYVYKRVKSYRTNPSQQFTPVSTPRVCWALTKKGEEFLQDRRPTLPFIPQGGHFDHQLLSSLIATSFEFGAQELALVLRYPEQILADPRCPKPLPKNPFIVSFAEKDRLVADAPLFGLRHGKRSMYFHGFEADRNKETLDGETKTSIVNKFRRYELYLKQDITFNRYGLTNINFLFVTTNATHMGNMMTLCEATVAKALHKHFHFKTFSDYAHHLDFPPATGRMVTEPWYDIGGTFSIMEALQERKAA